jgi:hypothetical protein
LYADLINNQIALAQFSTFIQRVVYQFTGRLDDPNFKGSNDIFASALNPDAFIVLLFPNFLEAIISKEINIKLMLK